MKRVLAFFGAFNPPTNAHIALAKLAMEQTGRDEVVFIPSQIEYILVEQKKDYAFSNGERLWMLNQIAAVHPWMRVESHDLRAPTQPRSYETLCWLRDTCQMSPTLLIGADQFCDMQKRWKNVPEIAKEFGIVCLTRNLHDVAYMLDHNPFYQDISAYVQVITTPEKYLTASSTEARNEFREVQSHLGALQNLVPVSAFNYIKERYI